MCGIIGYTGAREVLSVLLSGLDALSYRGYDSAGVSIYTEDSGIVTVKSGGRLEKLKEKIKASGIGKGTVGIGHSRWATHGAPTDTNAHPHATDILTLVHNGIIENHESLDEMLSREGYVKKSETDTESAAFLIDFYYKKYSDPIKAIDTAIKKIEGSYAFAIIFADRKDEVYAVRKNNPLIISLSDEGAYVASDLTALLGRCESFARPDDEVICRLYPTGVTYYTGEEITDPPKPIKVDWDINAAERGGYSHFMEKEIFEEPDVAERTVSRYTKNSIPCFPSDKLDHETIKAIKRVRIIACGTAMHSGLIAKGIIERLCKIPAAVEIASEFRYRAPIIEKDELVIFISQSGETADTLAALRYVKEMGVFTLSFANVIGSTIAAESDEVFYTSAGPEIAVASTKAYIAQCIILYLFAVYVALIKETIGTDEAKRLTETLSVKVPEGIKEALLLSEKTKEAARLVFEKSDMFYIGRCIDYDLATEGSLKLKEISYIHSEAYAAGELKHGTISLITDGTPVLVVMTDSAVAEKTLTGMRESAARGAIIIAVASKRIAERFSFDADVKIILPDIEEGFDIFSAATVMQLFAYHAASLRGLDVDKPRNLAKSVTVE